MSKNKILILLTLVALVAGFFALDLGRFFSLEQLKASQSQLAALHAERPWQVAGAYFAVYLLVAALSLPGAVILTLAGGAVFGLVLGTLLVSFASSIGATLAFLAARYFLRDSVRARFGKRMADIDQGVEREGGFYLFSLRLLPLVPFVVLNLALGLTRMRAGVYYLASQLGMLPGTIAYVNAGTQLSRIDSLAGILSPAVIGSFVLLAVLPLGAKKLLGMVQARKVYARWNHLKPRRFERNLVVIGAGSAGLVSAYIAAVVKAKVTLVEAHKMGGDCLNYGCVPSKALIKTASLLSQMRHSRDYGIADAQVRVDFADVMERVARIVREVEPHDSIERYTELGVDVVQGRARIVDPWRVQITRDDGTLQTLTTRSIIIATGAAPFVPPLPGLAEIGPLTSDTLWGLRELPRRLVVLGGGPIGCELAQAFARLGSEVTQIERGERLLSREDADVAALAQQALERDGVRVLTRHEALRCQTLSTADGPRKQIVVRTGDREQAIEFDQLLCAVGRSARLTGFGLEELGIPFGRTVDTNGALQTLYPNILAAGDVAGPYQFTHTASHQAWYAAVNALFGRFKTHKADYSVVPWATFIDPEVARVGLNEREATQQGTAHEVTRYHLDDLDRAIADSATRGFVKVLTVPGKDKILGVTIVGVHAADLLAEYVLAMKHGLGLNQILGTIHTYPTLSEANKYAAGVWKKAHQPRRLLRWVERYHAWERGA